MDDKPGERLPVIDGQVVTQVGGGRRQPRQRLIARQPSGNR